MNLNDVNRGIHKHKKRKRLGRGPGSGHGKTAGRGHKGAGSRAGYSMHPTFEGGQMPLARRIPKRGFHNQWALSVHAINVDDLEKWFEEGEEVSPQSLKTKKRVRGRYDVLKVLGDGELTKRLTVHAHRFSRAAIEKIEKAGGRAVVLAPQAKKSAAESNQTSEPSEP